MTEFNTEIGDGNVEYKKFLEKKHPCVQIRETCGKFIVLWSTTANDVDESSPCPVPLKCGFDECKIWCSCDMR